MLRTKKISIRQIRRYLKNREGTAAIEFAILAIPFFMLLFAILELAIVFFINSTLTHSISEASRQIRTGNFQACGSKEKFKELVCANMQGLGNCEKRLRIDVVTDNSFNTITLPAPPAPPDPAWQKSRPPSLLTGMSRTLPMSQAICQRNHKPYLRLK